MHVDELDDGPIVAAFDAIGFRLRPAPWNRTEISDGGSWPKLVFAPPANVHVRLVGSVTARRNLLLRDFLRADARARTAWDRFKLRLACTATDLYDYGLRSRRLPEKVSGCLRIVVENATPAPSQGHEWPRRAARRRRRTS